VRQVPLVFMRKEVLLFVNKSSGGGLGTKIIEFASTINRVHVISLPEESGSWFEDYRTYFGRDDLIIVVAGGDGTVNWVVSMLESHSDFFDNVAVPPISVIPTGTGNDLSHMLGWGGAFEMEDRRTLEMTLNKICDSRKVKEMDIWKVRYWRTDNNSLDEEKIMLNYFSVGVDASIAVDFETCRKTSPECFGCHCMSKSMYLPIGLKHMFGDRSLNEYLRCSVVDLEGNATPVRFDESDKTFVIQAITSIYGGSDMWPHDMERSINDKKFEVILQGGNMKLGLLHLGINLGTGFRQGNMATLFSSEPCSFQIDGEGKISNGPTFFNVTHAGSVQMIFSQ